MRDTRPEKQLECHYWRRDGYCKYSADECSYAHHPTGTVARNPELKLKDYKYQASKNHAPPVKYAECFYWQQGICKFTADECTFAHYPIPSDRRDTTPERRTKYISPDIIKEEAPSSKQIECYFWRRDGYCRFSEEDCLYAHHTTGKVKEGPGAYRALGPTRAIEGPDKISEVNRAPLPQSPKRKVSQMSHDADVGPKQYKMPKPAPQKLSELTLSAFFDLFCYANPKARQEGPWDTVIPFYKKFIIENFGKDNIKHIITALSRVC